MMNIVLYVVLTILATAMLLCFYRMVKGPEAADRVIALDAMGINLLAITAVVSIILRTDAYFEVILLIGLLSFIGTVAFSRFIERGAIFKQGGSEQDREEGSL